MRIVYLHQYFNTPSMGGSTRSFEFAKRLARQGHDVHIVTTSRDNAPQPSRGWVVTDESGFKVHWYPLAYSNHLSFLARSWVFVRFAIASSLRAFKLGGDLIFASSTPVTIALPGLLASGFGKYRPFVFEVRDLWPEMPIAIGALRNPVLKVLAKGLEKLTYSCSQSIIALSPGMRDGVIAAGANPKKVAVIPNSSDTELFSDASSEYELVPETWLGKPLLLYTGTLGLVNGIEYLVRLAEQLRTIDSNVRILVVGDGRERSMCIQLAKSFGLLDEYISFAEPVDKFRVASLYQVCNMASNIVIDLPEARANSANKFFDTLAAGKPILINHGGWMHDLVQSSSCGLSTWNISIADSAKILHERMNDRAWLNFASENAHSLATRCFDRDILFKKFYQVLDAAYAREGYRASELAPFDVDQVVLNLSSDRVDVTLESRNTI